MFLQERFSSSKIQSSKSWLEIILTRTKNSKELDHTNSNNFDVHCVEIEREMVINVVND